ncbi:hypothetical protein HYH02_000230 [Chlamydomonas schloesseri]|uniref:Uncharacterized protein n=1 Tax=Chlamydomonas schloesseri TaxID=2026947 RepID=A0A836B7P2_9CHLO|nr:hypothetical protein HYH02_000230 [Chlamydomonas schloesseri]|eukprot:KAG2450127.1 hypothetical protein HYH02_000230 [Chlamydomonas schloesseri]
MRVNSSESAAQNVPFQANAAVTATMRRFVNNKFAARDWRYLEEDLEQDAIMSGVGAVDGEEELFDLDLDGTDVGTPSSPCASPTSASHPGASPRAYTRAVCVSFAAGPVRPAAPADLEGRVKQLVSGLVAKSALAASLQQQPQQQTQQPWSLEQLAAHLRSAGLVAQVLSPPRPDRRSPLTTRSIRDPFLLVSAQPVNTTSGNTAATSSCSDFVIVDASLHDHMSVAPATPAYRRSLAAALPGGAAAPWVGTRSRLVSLVKSLAPAVSLNFSSQGMEVPPWRRTPALLRRWEGAEELAQGACAAAAHTQPQQTALQPAQPATLGPVVTVQPSASNGSSSSSCTPRLVVSGFEVGSTAVGQEPWRDAEPGSFSFSFGGGGGGAAWLQGAALERQRREEQQQPVEAPRPRSEDSEDSTADLVAGVSPVSVFMHHHHHHNHQGGGRWRHDSAGVCGSLVKAEPA